MSQDLFSAAIAVRNRAYAPYSSFAVGAAIRAADDKVYVGCNVENVAYPEGCCAEAGAISAMVAAGQIQIVEVLVVADANPVVSPCGGCRQKLAEFGAADVPVHLADLSGVVASWTLGDLLPAGFSDAQLGHGS